MESRITGTTMPVLEIGLEPGETIVAEPGQLVVDDADRATANQHRRGWHERRMGGAETRGRRRRAVHDGVLRPGRPRHDRVRRESARRHPCRCRSSRTPDTSCIATASCAGRRVSSWRIGFQQSLGAGLFGGTGFILQRITGYGTAWIELGGEIISRELAPGEQILVHPGHVGMFEEQVNCDVTMIRGIANAIFGGDGLFLMRLTRPRTGVAANA